MNEGIRAQIMLLARQLRLTALCDYDSIIHQMGPHCTFEELLLELLRSEQQRRLDNRSRLRLRQAGLPYSKSLDELDVSVYGGQITQLFISELGSCQFIREHRNLVMIGSPGRGKTHIAIGIALRACAAGMTVLYHNAAALCTQLREAREQLALGRLEEKLRRADLLILDELGYVRFDRHQSELLFKVVADRSERGSIIVTTNHDFADWGGLFDNEVLATALVDRLIYRSITLKLSGPSYRLAQTRRELSGVPDPPSA